MLKYFWSLYLIYEFTGVTIMCNEVYSVWYSPVKVYSWQPTNFYLLNYYIIIVPFEVIESDIFFFFFLLHLTGVSSLNKQVFKQYRRLLSISCTRLTDFIKNIFSHKYWISIYYDFERFVIRKKTVCTKIFYPNL